MSSLGLKVFAATVVGYAVASALDSVACLLLGRSPLMLIALLPSGLLLGWIQSRAFRPDDSNRRRWVILTAIGWLIANPTFLAQITPGRSLAFTFHGLVMGFLRSRSLRGARWLRFARLVISTFAAFLNGYLIEQSRTSLSNGFAALLVLVVGGGVLIGAGQALSFVMAGVRPEVATAAMRRGASGSRWRSRMDSPPTATATA